MRRPFGAVVVCELRLLGARCGPGMLVLAASASVAAVCFPVLVLGNDVRGGLATVVTGMTFGSIVAAGIGPVLVLASTGADFDTGLGQVRQIAGLPFRRLAVGQLVAVWTLQVGLVLGVGLGAGLGGAADALVRSVSGAAGIAGPGWGLSPIGCWAGIAAGSATTWLLVVAARSGRRAALIIVVLVGSLLVLLLRRVGPSSNLLAVHPLALPWSLVDPFPAAVLDISRSATMLAATLCWAALLGCAAARALALGTRRP